MFLKKENVFGLHTRSKKYCSEISLNNQMCSSDPLTTAQEEQNESRQSLRKKYTNCIYDWQLRNLGCEQKAIPTVTITCVSSFEVYLLSVLAFWKSTLKSL